MATTAMGPTMAGGMQPIVKDGYELLYLPDVNNNQLQKEGQSPVFYWVPNQVRMAHKDGPDKGDPLFQLLRFSGEEGEQTEDTADDKQVAGGLLTFTVTGAAPDHVLEQSQQAITAQFTRSDDFFWGIQSGRPPVFRPAIVTSNVTTVSNISPTPRGLPMLQRGARSPGAPIVSARGVPPARDLTSITTSRDAAGDSNIDPWYWHMQGQGSGSIDPSGQNAYSALVGSYPAAILYAGFHGTAAPLIVIQNMKLKMWSPQVELRIVGHWKKIFDHFSAHAQGRYMWASVDIKAELNRMRTSGDIEVEILVDSTIPGGEEIARKIDERSDLVFQKFMEAAQTMIFEPPQPQVEAAQASSSGGSIFSPWGAGLALKYRRDETDLELKYHEKRQIAYLQDHTISSSLSGVFDEMKKEGEDAEAKYFPTVYLDDWPRTLARVCHPIAAWGDKAVEMVSVQCGYPNTEGKLMWEGHVFGPPAPDGGDDTWKYRIAQKEAAHVSNPPEGWEPDMTFIKRKVHLVEPPSELDDPYVRIQVDKDEIAIDPEPNGRLMNDTTIEVRADSAGRLAVGPIELGVVLTDNTQVIEVTMEPTDDQGEPVGRKPVRFRWSFDDVDKDRLWLLYTGDPEFRPFFRYKVDVTVKGTLFEPGRAWTGPWMAAAGNGPVTITIPRPTDADVTTRTLPDFETAAADGVAPAPADVPRTTVMGVPVKAPTGVSGNGY
jgi:hypothetical protein